MTKHWIRTSYVPERNKTWITPNSWYELSDYFYDKGSKSGFGMMTQDDGDEVGVFIKRSTWLDGEDWDYCESYTYPR